MNEQYQGIVRLYRDLIQLRLNTKGYSRGLCGQFLNIYHVNDPDKIIAFQRWDQHGPGDDVILVFNFSSASKENYEIGMPSAGLWKLRLNSDAPSTARIFRGFSAVTWRRSATPGMDWMPARRYPLALTAC